MKILYLIFIILFLNNCTKPKTVLICGDHVCVNKAEAEQYFEDNLTLEVKIVDKPNDNEPSLIELNMQNNQEKKKVINIFSKKKTSSNLKKLSKKEKKIIKREINSKRKKKRSKIKITKKEDKKIKKDKKTKDINLHKENIKKREKKVVDICTILNKCSIDEITKYLLNKGKKDKYPNITNRN